MKNIRTSRIICSIMLMGCLISSGCAAEQEESVVTEPTANCEITGYVQYAGKNKEMFLSEGDVIAVISPSALPERQQVDAVMDGLKKWGV
ncbi:MAG: hypothetical protein IKD69_09625 [Solobacterium sp.]|nr:hypothetical protein [Solobacterium sp.]